MSYTIEVRPDAPIIIISHTPGSHVADDIPDIASTMKRVLEEQPEPVFLIIDLTGTSMSLGDHLKASTASTREQDAPMHHPGVREHLFVGADPVTKMAVSGLASATFGMINVPLFDTLDKALAYCREQLDEPARGRQPDLL